MRIALDPTPLHHTHAFLEFPRVAAELGYEWIQLTPHVDFMPFFRHPRADRALISATKKAAKDAGVGISSLLPVYRWSSPEEAQREAAVRNFRRLIEIAVELEVRVINTEFSGRPERSEDSEAGFFRSMEELLPIIEREGIRVNIDPHPDDFVEEGHEAVRVIRSLDSAHVGFVYVGSHTFHYGDDAPGIIAAAGERLGAAYAADSFDHHRSHGLRYISNPPGNTARVHQHLRIGDGDVNWDEYYDALHAVGFLDRDDALIVSNVFAEDEQWEAISRFQLEAIRAGIASAHRRAS
ncbi:sugar phosphate isomerase/epimerase [Microcella alkalica]|uniref:Myo-inositol catabolism protein IolH n=1 Tax=Microcella alkalica TaxID=355930 RepID=A0A839E405_9MICO|nr:sugar phosphate isomerase/epimerase family protein [Microcella alkalica]MBA8846530.1 myo-inositol catabolism protein IolH [Microcella alkalica]